MTSPSERRPTMMGHREALNSGDEVDAVGSHRHDNHWHPGERKAIKQQLGKRARRIARLALQDNSNDGSARKLE